MAELKVTGQIPKEIRVWDGTRWVSRVGKVFDGTKFVNFSKPILTFKDDMISIAGLSRRLEKTYLKSYSHLSGSTSRLVLDQLISFSLGDEITITDGVNSENVIITTIAYASIKVYYTTRLKNTYVNNAIVARTNTVIQGSKLLQDTHRTYSVK